MKKLLAILLLMILLPVSSLSEPVPHTLEKRNVPVYCCPINDYGPAEDMVLMPEFSLYYADGVDDLPYVDLLEFTELVNRVGAFDAGGLFGEPAQPKEDYISRINGDQGIFTCTYQPQKSDLIIDFKQGNLTYSCMDTFGKDPAYAPHELQTNQLDFLQRIYDPKLSRLGSARTVSLVDYGITMLTAEGKYLLPLHTAFDFLVWVPKAPRKILFCNGAAIFIGEAENMFGYDDAPSELGELYWARQPAKRSPGLAEYGYHELCLILDSFYGLKDSHHIDNFRDLFKANGYEEMLLSEDPKEADQALLDIVAFVLDDFHSNFGLPSWMSGKEAGLNYEGNGFSGTFDARKKETFEKVLKAFSKSSLDSNDFTRNPEIPLI